MSGIPGGRHSCGRHSLWKAFHTEGIPNQLKKVLFPMECLLSGMPSFGNACRKSAPWQGMSAYVFRLINAEMVLSEIHFSFKEFFHENDRAQKHTAHALAR